MVNAPEMDPIRNPLQVIQTLYQQAGFPQAGGDFDVSVQLRELLAERDLLAKVPLLTHESAQHLPNQSLVRFQGMIQDMADPQYYHGSVQLPDGSWQTTKYGDQIPPDTHLSVTKIWERRPMYCIPVPGRSAWTQPEAGLVQTASDNSQESRPKRTRGDGDGDAMVPSDGSTDQAAPVGASAEGGAADQPAKISKTVESQGPAGAAAAGSPPGYDVRPGDCIVHVYDTPEGNLCLHDLVDVIGVLSHAPELAAWHMGGEEEEGACEHGMTGDEDGGCQMCESDARGVCDQEVPRMLQSLSLQEQQASNPPTSKVLRLHAILVNRNAPLHVKPFAPAAAPAAVDAGPAVAAPAPALPASQARAAALKLLGSCLGGDDVAAEYVLLSTLARVTSRPTNGSQTVVGMLPLNITRCPTTITTTAPGPVPSGGSADAKARSPVGGALHGVLSSLLPMAAYLPLTVSSCNAGGGWVPRRDPDTSRVSRSPLQLPRGCMLVVDEVTLGEGRLNETGVRSLQALHGLLQEQVLGYDFEFCAAHPFPVEVPAVVLSEGRSLLHAALAVSLPLAATRPLITEQQVADLVTALPPGTLEAVRSYLADAVQAPYSISDEMVDMLQHEFVAARKSDPASFSAEAFQLRLTMARLSALSWGEDELTPQRWRAVQALEAQRMQRTVSKTGKPC